MVEVYQLPLHEPSDTEMAKKYQMFEDFLDGGLNPFNFPTIIQDPKSFLLLLLRYCMLQGYDSVAILSYIRQKEFFDPVMVSRAEVYKLNVRHYPDYNRYLEIFGLDPITNPDDDSFSSEDAIIDIAHEISTDPELRLMYIDGVRMFIYWNGFYYEFDRKNIINQRIRETIKRKNEHMNKKIKERKSNINEIRDYLFDYNGADLNDFDTNLDYISFKNGIWDKSTQKFSPPDPNYLSLRVIEREYTPVNEMPAPFKIYFDGLEWCERDVVRLLSLFKAVVEHECFCNKKLAVLYGEPNSGKSLAAGIITDMMGETRTDMITPISRILDKYTAGNLETKIAAILDDVQMYKLPINIYEILKTWTNAEGFMAECKFGDPRTIYPYFSLIMTLNDLFQFPDSVNLIALSQRFLLFVFDVMHEPNKAFRKTIRESAGDFLNYLLTASWIPKITDIPPLPYSEIDTIENYNPERFIHYWNSLAQKLQFLIKDIFSFHEGVINDFDEIVDYVNHACNKRGFQIEKQRFSEKLLPKIIQEKGGYLDITYSKADMRQSKSIINIYIKGARNKIIDKDILSKSSKKGVDAYGVKNDDIPRTIEQ